MQGLLVCAATYFDHELFRLNTNQFLQTARTVTFLIQKNRERLWCIGPELREKSACMCPCELHRTAGPLRFQRMTMPARPVRERLQ
jgi:hypothetical protein